MHTPINTCKSSRGRYSYMHTHNTRLQTLVHHPHIHAGAYTYTVTQSYAHTPTLIHLHTYTCINASSIHPSRTRVYTPCTRPIHTGARCKWNGQHQFGHSEIVPQQSHGFVDCVAVRQHRGPHRHSPAHSYGVLSGSTHHHPVQELWVSHNPFPSVTVIGDLSALAKLSRIVFTPNK